MIVEVALLPKEKSDIDTCSGSTLYYSEYPGDDLHMNKDPGDSQSSEW